jgi:dihydrofolate synthase/folylpolyglutamate synthase
LTLSLRGGHQIGNAAVAVRLLESANRRGIAIGKHAIERGLTTTRWPGRLELLVFNDGRRLLLDAAHNVEGAQALAAYLAEWHAERPPIVLGVMSDKDVEGIVRTLLPVTSTVIVTAARIRRAMDPAELAARISALDPSRVVHTEPEPASAVERAFHEADCVCAAGSIFLVGAIREAFRGRAILH